MAADLPTIGLTIETATRDLKVTIDPSDRFELAKDVAAFANHVGGSIVIGIPQRDGTAGRPVPLTAADAAAFRRAYEEAVRDRCRPAPLVDCQQVAVAGGYIIVVNVDPYAGLVGVAQGDKRTHGFPQRTASQTVWLTPDQIPLFLDPHMRRIANVLEQIAKGSTVHVRMMTKNDGGCETMKPVFDGFNISENTITFLAAQGRAPISLPLDQVETAWRDGEEWKLIFKRDFFRSF